MNLKDMLLYFVLQNIKTEEVIFTICEFIKSQIDFDFIHCCLIDREEMRLTNFIEYTPTNVLPSSFHKIEKLFPLSHLESLFGEDFSQVWSTSLSKETINSEILSALELYSNDYNCAATFCISSLSNKSQFIFFTILSKEKNTFSEKDINFIKAIRPIVKEYFTPFIMQNSEEYLRLTSIVSLPRSLTEQLEQSQDLAPMLHEAKIVAKFDTIILITGNTGTGKSLLAEYIHYHSHQSHYQMVKVNCGAIPESLIEAELFGYEKGAFTGAIQVHKGYFEQANNSTIFLDEIGELSLNAQVKLLKVIEEGVIRRIGSSNEIKLNIRIILATNKNLVEMMNKKTFREDLFYRIAVFPIHLPDLQKRKRDLPLLIEYYFNFYLEKFKVLTPPKLSYKALAKLIQHKWPGNIRELRHTLEHAILKCISSDLNELEFPHLPDVLQGNQIKYRKKHSIEEIQEALNKCKGKIHGKNGAAELLSIPPSTLRSQLKNLKIENKKDKINRLSL